MGPFQASNLGIQRHFRLGILLLPIREKQPKQMITLQDFQYASFEKKCDVVTSYSDYLSMRLLGECKVYLYHTEQFFIEVYYSPNYKKVLMINAFNDATGLSPYADTVSLSDLNL
jgi:hypothetical protein